MEAMDSAFFEAAAESLNHSKINYMNMAGIQPVTVEERHVVTRLPANYMHMNHVGIVYAGSYFVFAEASGATLIKCTYAGRYTPIIKSCSIDYVRPAARDLFIDLSMDEDTAREKILALREANVVNFGSAGKPIAQALVAEVERKGGKAAESRSKEA